MRRFPSRFRRLDDAPADLPLEEPMLLTELEGLLTGVLVIATGAIRSMVVGWYSLARDAASAFRRGSKSAKMDSMQAWSGLATIRHR